MITLSPEILTIILLAGIVVGILIGFPLAIPIGAMTLIFGYLLLGNGIFELMYSRAFRILNHYVLLAVPLFILMGTVLEKAGLADRMYNALYLWLGGLRGGLAIVTIVMGTVLAACVGVVGASVTMLSLLALNAMIKRGYDKSLASGVVCAAGTLGILIPPSVMLVVYGPMAGVSVGKLFFGAFTPGVILATLYCAYVYIRCLKKPELAPVIPPAERAIPFIKKITILLSSLVPPVVLILSVLGTIFLGIAPPTEAAAVGGLVAMLLMVLYGKFSVVSLRSAALETLRASSMIFLIAAISFSFVGLFITAGCGKVVENLILSAPGGRWGAFVVIMFIFFLLGFFMDWIGSFFIMVPIVAPIAYPLGFDPVWFGLMICLNQQTSYMTPPFAPAIFYLRGAASPELGITMADIIRGVVPFILIVIVMLGLCAIFPDIILWLPNLMIA